jgi:signal transduction histidine kinase
MDEREDRVLIEELRSRLEGRERALADLRATRRTLETVNERLVAAEAVRTHFISNIRNEINNPLTAILGLAREIAARDGGGEQGTLAEALADEAFALDFQIRNILTAAEIEAGACVVRVARVDARRVLEEVVSSCSRLGAGRGIRLAFRWQGSPQDATEFPTDPAKLALIVANLVSNAVKFSPEGTEIVVAGYRAGTWLLIRVEDAGGGIPPEHRELIFERFRQLSAGPSKGWQGHGLGLAVVRALLEALGGSIEVEDRPGLGSVFTVRVPEGAVDGTVVPAAPEGNELVFGEERF